MGGGGVGRVGWGGGPGGAIWGGGGGRGWHKALVVSSGGGGGGAPLTSPFHPSNHTITINLTLTFAVTWFGHASRVDWAEHQIEFHSWLLLPHHCSPFWTPILTLTLA